MPCARLIDYMPLRAVGRTAGRRDSRARDRPSRAVLGAGCTVAVLVGSQSMDATAKARIEQRMKDRQVLKVLRELLRVAKAEGWNARNPITPANLARRNHLPS